MKHLLPETIWRLDDRRLSTVLDGRLLFSKLGKIHFYAPSFMYYKTSYYRSSPLTFPTISLTGKGCALKCKHCGGVVLETMYPVKSPGDLFQLCLELKKKGALGCLISGGCLPNGSVPIEHFLNAINKIKRELGLTVFLHTGVISQSEAKALREAKVDAALIDIIGSNETVREICDVDINVADYDASLKALRESGIPFVPHVIVGLHYGKLKGEFTALEMIKRCSPNAIVIIAFMPIHNTEMEKVKPPKPLAIAKVLATARLMFPETPLVLGCMRPKGNHRTETDMWAVKAGVDAIAFPAEEAIRFAASQGLEPSFSSFCCSQIFTDSKNKVYF
jgi:uncharacterized radical SAM superfamily protein